MTKVPGRGERVSLDQYEASEYDPPVNLQGSNTIGAVRFLKMRPGGLVLVHAKGVNLARIRKANGIPYRIVKGLYVQVDARLISSARNCVAVKREHLGALKREIGN